MPKAVQQGKELSVQDLPKPGSKVELEARLRGAASTTLTTTTSDVMAAQMQAMARKMQEMQQ